jgi:catechol 2,3-dioxygenase-like lactoylglutathione lyase family enzyme
VSKRDRPDEFTIITPVSRLLGAIDLARTRAFYRDVLGFDVHRPDGEPQALEVVSGQARIRFGSHDYGPGDWNEPHAPGAAVVFFETDNVEGLHTAVRARGGTPSALEMVNAIKMRVFEIRDPASGNSASWISRATRSRSASRSNDVDSRVRFTTGE